MLFKKPGEKVNLVEETKMFRTIPVRTIRKNLAVCEVEGTNSENCKKLWKEAGIEVVE